MGKRFATIASTLEVRNTFTKASGPSYAESAFGTTKRRPPAQAREGRQPPRGEEEALHYHPRGAPRLSPVRRRRRVRLSDLAASRARPRGRGDEEHAGTGGGATRTGYRRQPGGKPHRLHVAEAGEPRYLRVDPRSRHRCEPSRAAERHERLPLPPSREPSTPRWPTTPISATP